MEGGQKIDLDLDRTGIDVKSSDMLVSLNNPKFAHNRQRWQGHVLPTSLRYERNGWAAGWYVYEFEFEDGYIYDSQHEYALDRIRLNNNPTYICRLHKVIDDTVQSTILATFMQNTKTSFITSDLLDFTVAYDSDSLDTSHTCKFNNKSVSFDIHAPTYINGDNDYSIANVQGDNVSVDISDNTLSADGMLSVNVTDNAAKLNFNGKFTLPADVKSTATVNGTLYTYDFAKFNKLENSDLVYESSMHSVSEYYGQNFIDIDGTSIQGTVADGIRLYNYNYNYSYDINIKFNTYIIIPYILELKTSENFTALASDADVSIPVNNINVTLLTDSISSLDNATLDRCTVDIDMPIWTLYTFDFSSITPGTAHRDFTLDVVHSGTTNWGTSPILAAFRAKCYTNLYNSSTSVPTDGHIDSELNVVVFVRLFSYFESNQSVYYPKADNTHKYTNMVYDSLNGYVHSGLNDFDSPMMSVRAGSKLTVASQYKNITSERDSVKGIWIYYDSDHSEWCFIVPEGYTGDAFDIPLDSVILPENVNGRTYFIFDCYIIDENNNIKGGIPGGKLCRVQCSGTNNYGPKVQQNGTEFWPSTVHLVAGVQHYYTDYSPNVDIITGNHTLEDIKPIIYQKPYIIDTTSGIKPVYMPYRIRLDSMKGWSGLQSLVYWLSSGLYTFYDFVPDNDTYVLYGQKMLPQIKWTDSIVSVAMDATYKRRFNIALTTSVREAQANGLNSTCFTVSENRNFIITSNIYDFICDTTPDYYHEFIAVYTLRVKNVTLNSSKSNYDVDTTLKTTNEGNIEISAAVISNAGRTQYINYSTTGSEVFIPKFNNIKGATSKSAILDRYESITLQNNIVIKLSGKYKGILGIHSASIAVLPNDYIVDHYFFSELLPKYIEKTRTSSYNTFISNGDIVVPNWSFTNNELVSTDASLMFKQKKLSPGEGVATTSLALNSLTGTIYLTDSEHQHKFDHIDELYDSDITIESIDGTENSTTATNGIIHWMKDSGFIIKRTWTLPYTLRTVQPVPPTDWSLNSIEDGVMSFNKGSYTVKYDIANSSVVLNYTSNNIMYTYSIIDKTIGIETLHTVRNDVTLKFSQDIYGTVKIAPKGVFAFDGTGYTLSSLEYPFNVGISHDNDNVYFFDMLDFENVERYLNVYSIDVRNPDVDARKHIQKINCSREKQLLKQFWDTDVLVENFWWISDSYVMKLTDDYIIIYQKAPNAYDDWQADVWNEYRKLPRTDYITSAIKRYFCTNAFGEHATAYARFCTIEALDNDTFRMKFYDVLAPLVDGKLQYKQYDVDIIKREIGQPLYASNNGEYFGTTNKPQLRSYTRIQMPVFLSEVCISATCCDGYIAVGFHYDNNFNQWTLLVDASTSAPGYIWRVIQGYGYVGVDGHLTGGQIPQYCFDAMRGGFTGTVEDISVLNGTDTDITDISKLDSFTNRIVGNENQQWYITMGMTGIVSHIKMLTLAESGNPQVEVLPITNNYASIYESPSFVIRKSGDIGIGAKTLQGLFPSDDSTFQTLWTIILVAVGYPLIYYINPKISTINYLQQTLGQYAYVHYNSTAIRKQIDPTNDNLDSVELSPIDLDELSFDVFHVPQEQDVGANPWHTLLYAIGAAGLNALEYGIEKLQVNTHIGQQTTADKGMQFSQMFQKNIDSMSSAEFTVQSVTPVNKSEVTAVKTLDMFYSTSAGQHVEAGPGFVAHNFVAQCVAQSVTSVQLESQQVTMMYIIKALTIFQLNLEYKALKIAADLIKNNADGQGGTAFTIGGVATGTSYGWIVTLVLNSVYAALKLAQLGIETAIENIDPLLDALGASQFKSSITAKQSKHTYDVEAKHKYGSKHETFMWPCFNCSMRSYKDEYVVADTQNKPWSISISPYAEGVIHTNIGEDIVLNRPATATIGIPDGIKDSCVGDIDYRIAACRGESKQRVLPDDMAVVIGAESFMPAENFKNVNIAESEPVFTTPVIQDFIISKQYELSMTCTAGEIIWVSCRDTKLIDGAPSNIVYSKGFCGVASTYTAIEIRNAIEPDYLRPWAVTPDILAINMTGLNVMYDEQMYHGFDGIGYRLTDWLGAPGMNKEHYTLQYAFQINDRLKRSNKLPPNQFLGNFTYDPSYATDTHDAICSIVTVPGDNRGLEAGTIGEDKDVQRYSVPIFTEFVSTLPAAIKTAQPYKLAVVDGITSLTTDIRNTQVAYKTPVSNDFVLGQQLYRATQEYICVVTEKDGAVVVTPVVPTLGMHYIGATPFEAFFYSQATRQYYSYAGGSDIRLISMLERFRDIISGRWDFVNQNVIMPCLATFDRLDSEVKDDDDETDNIMILALADADVRREVTPPVKTIFKARPKASSDRTYNADASCDMGFRVLSLPSGLTYQGPNRCIINRYTWSEYMLGQVKANKGKWKKVPREVYHPFREYYQNYASVNQYIDNGVKGWTHNPFLLVTAPLGVREEVDCKFEWEITFAWTIEMDKLYESDEYVCVNICTETMTPGGKVVERPTHVYLTKDLFTRTGKYGYYSFRHQSNGGAGNRERLHIWSDGYIAVSSVQVEFKAITQKRNEILTQQVDIKALKEF